MKGLPPLALAAALAACVTAQPVEAVPSTRLGETVQIGGIGIRPLSVVEDSRCPANADCVWEGRIVVRTEVHGGGATSTHDLILGEQVAVARGRLALVAAEPQRNVREAIRPEAYRFAFAFDR